MLLLIPFYTPVKRIDDDEIGGEEMMGLSEFDEVFWWFCNSRKLDGWMDDGFLSLLYDFKNLSSSLLLCFFPNKSS